MTHTRVLPLRVGVQPGEGLDSWLQALGHRNGLSISALLSTFGLPRDPFTRHLVTKLPPATLRGIEAQAGLDTGRLDQAVVGSGFPFGPQRQRRSRFCPQCLSEREGRWLLAWWLPWTFACTRHQTLLHDSCPGCGLGSRVHLPRRTHLHPPATCTTWNKQQDKTCGTDLAAVPPLPLLPGSPLLDAQRWIDERVEQDAPDQVHALMSDLHACTPWLMQIIAGDDLEGLGKLVSHAWNQRPHDRHNPVQRFRHIDAPVRAVVAHIAAPLISGRDEGRAVESIRALRQRCDTKNKIIPWGMSAQRWNELTPRTRSLFLRAGDPQMGALDRVRYRSLTARAGTPRPDDPRAGARIHHVPQLLWPSWTVRLMPRTGTEETPFRAVASALLLVPGEPDLSARRITARLHPHLPNTMTATLMIALHNGHADVLTALCNLADYLDEHGSPINYERRRFRIPAVSLTEEDWRQLCFDTGTQPGESVNAKAQAPRYVHAQRFLHQLLTGSDISDPRSPLAPKSPSDRSRYAGFHSTLTTAQRDAFHQRARAILDRLGIDEPVTWEPPQELAAGLCLPGRRMNDLDFTALRRIVVTEQRSLSEAADELDTTITHLRFALEYVLHQPRAWGRNNPLAAWQLRERARAILTPDYFRREYTEGDRTLGQIAQATTIPRHVVVEQAKAHGITIRRTRRPTPMDETWLREQYLTRKRSTNSIAQELGTTNETVRRRLQQLTIPLRAAGVHSRQEMIAKLGQNVPRDIRKAVEGGLQGWHRLHRFKTTMAFPSLDTAATYLRAHQSALVTQFQRLEHDIGATLFHRSAFGKPHHPTSRGKALLRHLDSDSVRALMNAALPSNQIKPMPDATVLARAKSEMGIRRPPTPRPYTGITVPRIRIRAETLTLLQDLLAHHPKEFYAAQVGARTGINGSSLSPRFRQLEQLGWLTSRPEDDAAWIARAPAGCGPGRRRTYYSFTTEGHRAATHEVEHRRSPTCKPSAASQPA